MPDKLRIAIIGAGSFACRYHIPNLLARDDCEIAAAVKRDEATRRMVTERFGIPRGFGDHVEMLDAVRPDAVIVCSPHHLHHRHCMDALDRGAAVLAEKPLTIDPAEARELAGRSRETGLPLLVAYNRRVDPCYREGEAILREGGIGEVRFMEGRRFADLSWMLLNQPPPNQAERDKWWPDADRPSFRANPGSMGEGFLDDGGTHIIDALLWLAPSRPVSVNGLVFQYPSGVEARSSFSMAFEDGVMASVSCSADTQAVFMHEVIIHGSEGALVLSKESIEVMRGGKMEKPEPRFPRLTTTGHFIDVLKGEAGALCPAEAAAAPIEVARAVFESARTGKTIELDG